MSLLLGNAQSAVAPLVPGIPVFGSGTRQIFTANGTFVSDGRQVRVYVIAAAGGNGTAGVGAGGGAATALVTPTAGNVTVTVGARGANGTTGVAGGNSSFGTGAYLVAANGGGGGPSVTSGNATGGSGTTGDLLSQGQTSGNTSATGLYGPARSGYPALPYGVANMNGNNTEGGGVVIVEY